MLCFLAAMQGGSRCILSARLHALVPRIQEADRWVFGVRIAGVQALKARRGIPHIRPGVLRVVYAEQWAVRRRYRHQSASGPVYKALNLRRHTPVPKDGKGQGPEPDDSELVKVST